MAQELSANDKRNVHEVGKEIWSLIVFREGNNYGNVAYKTDFASWYKDVFPACIDKAAQRIFDGKSTYEKGSFFELNGTETKDETAHRISFNKEHFIEYYGEEAAKRLFSCGIKGIVNYTPAILAENGTTHVENLFLQNSLYNLFCKTAYREAL